MNSAAPIKTGGRAKIVDRDVNEILRKFSQYLGNPTILLIESKNWHSLANLLKTLCIMLNSYLNMVSPIDALYFFASLAF